MNNSYVYDPKTHAPIKFHQPRAIPEIDMNNVSILSRPTAPSYAPTLSSSAMLVEMNISLWVGRKTDKGASAQVLADNHASKGMASVSKRLLDCEQLDALKTHVGAMRLAHRAATLPWSESGLRLVTNAQYMDYHKEVTGMINEFYKLVEKLIDAYQWEVADAQTKLGDLFDISEYPMTDDLRRKFRVSLSYMPLPSSGDFRLDVGNDAQNVLREQYEKHYTTQITRAMGDLWQRLLEPLQNMSQRLSYGKHDRPSGFRDTLVSNVEDIAALLKTCNITGDPAMEQIRIDLVRAMRGVTPDGLRQDSYLRSATKSQIDNILTRAQGAAAPALASLDM
jgi:hypothetical protein